MTRKELANKMFDLVKKKTIKHNLEIWKAIAETDDYSLLSEYEFLMKEEAEFEKE